MALPALKARPLAAPAPVAAPRVPGRPALYADHLPARPIAETPSRAARRLLRELARLAFVAGVLAGPIAVLLKATS